MRKRVLLATVSGPRDLADGVDRYDIMAARLARGQGMLTTQPQAKDLWIG